MTDVNSLYGLVFDCPFFDRQDDCPLKDFDNLSFKEKVERINVMSREDIVKIIEYHIDCSKRRDHRQ